MRNIRVPIIASLRVPLGTVALCLGIAASAQEWSGEDLDVLKARITDARLRMEASADEQARRRMELEAVEKEINAAGVRQTELATSLTVITQSMEAGQDDLDAVRSELDRQKEEIVAVVRTRHALAATSSATVILALNEPTELTRMTEYYRYLSEWQKTRMAVLESQTSRLEEIMASMNASRVEKERAVAALDTEADRLKSLQQQRSEQLLALDESMEDQRALIDFMERRARRLTTLMEEIARAEAEASQRRQASAIQPPVPAEDGARFSTMRGGLQWPARGPLSRRFGQTDTQTGVPDQGITLGIPVDTPVFSVYTGTVVFADWFGAYGLLLIIDHGDGYMSLYAHNSQLNVKVGDRVAAGQRVADSGDTGGLGKPGLYFEIRHRGEPRDPGSWLRVS